jgi:hypothetical protein
MARLQYRTCIQLALGVGVVTAVCALCWVGATVELGKRAIVWLCGCQAGGGELAGQDEVEDPLDEDERG